MKQLDRIIVAGNGPSAYSEPVKMWGAAESLLPSDRIFRVNYFYLPDADPLGYRVTDWFICEDVADCRAVRAMARFSRQRPTIWLPGLNKRDIVPEIERNHLSGFDVRIQKTFARLPAGCRWERDLAPERPLMGSYAIAVAVGMQPKELFLCGHDLFSHPSGISHAGTKQETRGDWQAPFNASYLENRHRNHRLTGDVKYIRNALKEYEGSVVAVGDVLAGYFKDEFPEWEWING